MHRPDVDFTSVGGEKGKEREKERKKKKEEEKASEPLTRADHDTLSNQMMNSEY